MTDPTPPPRVFLLSPARLDGRRAQSLFHPSALRDPRRPKTPFPLARALRTVEGAPIGEVFRFCSSLYFRGKLAYATKFARPPENQPSLGSGALVITANRGFVPAETRVCLEHLEAFAETDIHADARGFTVPLERDARALLEAMGDRGEIVLLGSVASGKYVTSLVKVLGDRLLFPAAFVGRGDMSRGGLLLRQVEQGVELDYCPVATATRKGKRPPKLPRRRSGSADPSR